MQVLCVTAICLPAPLAAQTPSVYRIPTDQRANHVQLIGLEDDEAAAPVERLKQRSPQDRWDELKAPRAADVGVRVAPADEPEQRTSRGTARELPDPFDAGARGEPIPMLPDVSVFREFGDAPGVPAALPQVEHPQPAEPMRRYDETLPPPDAIRSLKAIDPYHSFKGTQTDGAGIHPAPPGVDVSRIPEDVLIPTAPYEPRLSPDTVFTWEASNLWHNPLYFEDPTLERYGHVAHPLVQPVVSTLRMTTQMLGLPYQSTIDPPGKHRYTLGWYRPGNWAPEKIYQVPFNWDAAAVQTGWVTGGIFLFP